MKVSNPFPNSASHRRCLAAPCSGWRPPAPARGRRGSMVSAQQPYAQLYVRHPSPFPPVRRYASIMTGGGTPRVPFMGCVDSHLQSVEEACRRFLQSTQIRRWEPFREAMNVVEVERRITMPSSPAPAPPACRPCRFPASSTSSPRTSPPRARNHAGCASGKRPSRFALKGIRARPRRTIRRGPVARGPYARRSA